MMMITKSFAKEGLHLMLEKWVMILSESASMVLNIRLQDKNLFESV